MRGFPPFQQAAYNMEETCGSVVIKNPSSTDLAQQDTGLLMFKYSQPSQDRRVIFGLGVLCTN